MIYLKQMEDCEEVEEFEEDDTAFYWPVLTQQDDEEEEQQDMEEEQQEEGEEEEQRLVVNRNRGARTRIGGGYDSEGGFDREEGQRVRGGMDMDGSNSNGNDGREAGRGGEGGGNVRSNINNDIRSGGDRGRRELMEEDETDYNIDNFIIRTQGRETQRGESNDNQVGSTSTPTRRNPRRSAGRPVRFCTKEEIHVLFYISLQP